MRLRTDGEGNPRQRCLETQGPVWGSVLCIALSLPWVERWILVGVLSHFVDSLYVKVELSCECWGKMLSAKQAGSEDSKTLVGIELHH